MSVLKPGDRVMLSHYPTGGDNNLREDTERIRIGSLGTYWGRDQDSNSWAVVSWDDAYDFLYDGKYGFDDKVDIWCVALESLTLATEVALTDRKTALVLRKIKYLDERKPRDKSRIVPPKGIYRGSKHLPEVSQAREAGSLGQGTVSSVSASRQRILDQESINRLLEFLGSRPVRTASDDYFGRIRTTYLVG